MMNSKAFRRCYRWTYASAPLLALAGAGCSSSVPAAALGEGGGGRGAATTSTTSTHAAGTASSTTGLGATTGSGGASSVGATTGSGGASTTSGSGAAASSAATSASAAMSSAASTGAGGSSCTPVCAGKQCGADGCNGTCGACPATELCSAAGQCAPATGGALEVDAQSGLTTISPAIYGVAFAEAKSLSVATVQRFGGDCSSMYNWKTDAFNCGADYIYANQPLPGFGYPPFQNVTSGNAIDYFVNFNKQNNVDSLVTVPMIGWVAKDSTSIGNQSGANPAGDAVATDGPFMQGWIQHLVSTFGGAGAGGVKYYQLDNEVDNWANMHPDVHPNPASSTEIWNGIQTYGGAIKAADPNATVLVYSPATLEGLVYSPLDETNFGVDEPMGSPLSNGKVTNPFSAWLLKQAAMYEQAHGVRILDCLDMHYPTAGSNPVEDVRSLWDPTYDENSWLTQDCYHEPLQIIPRMQQWVAQNYPGTGVCISEYQYYPPTGGDGTADPASGVAEADALGVFGKYGVKLATYWTTLTDAAGKITPTYNAFAMYRNYDGMGGHFGDTSVGATSQVADVTIYAAVDTPSAPTKLWVMIVNKTATAQNDVALKIDNFAPGATAAMYQSTGSSAPKALAGVPVTGGSLTVSLPALSINLLVLTKP